MHLLPPPDLAARLTSCALDHRHTSRFDCAWTSPDSAAGEALVEGRFSRRAFLGAAGAALLAFGSGISQDAHAAVSGKGTQKLKRGQIPDNFWELPRALRLQRAGAGQVIDVEYWKNGSLIPSGYWRVCSVLRDVRANVMTSIDPALLDILCGVQAYYEAWDWPHPIIITSGFRTVATNRALSREGSARNSLHVQGKAADLYIPGVPPRDISLLGMHLRQGGVGFYPSKGFTHLDSGAVRVWRG